MLLSFNVQMMLVGNLIHSGLHPGSFLITA